MTARTGGARDEYCASSVVRLTVVSIALTAAADSIVRTNSGFASLALSGRHGIIPVSSFGHSKNGACPRRSEQAKGDMSMLRSLRAHVAARSARAGRAGSHAVMEGAAPNSFASRP